jgi:GTP:adenosylcobinamide-phosphate guanylyltransferase
MTKEKPIMKYGGKKMITHNAKMINGNVIIVACSSIMLGEPCITMNDTPIIVARSYRMNDGNTITMTDIFRTNDKNTIIMNDNAIMAKCGSIIKK